MILTAAASRRRKRTLGFLLPYRYLICYITFTTPGITLYYIDRCGVETKDPLSLSLLSPLSLSLYIYIYTQSISLSLSLSLLSLSLYIYIQNIIVYYIDRCGVETKEKDPRTFTTL